MTHHRTLYVKTETGGRSSWLQIFWACTECNSLNHVVLPCYRLESVPPGLPSALATSIVDALRNGPLDMAELLTELRRRRNEGIHHIFSSEVGMAVAYLRSRGVVAEATIDRTTLTVDALRARPWKSKHLGPCPAELKQGVVMKNMVSLYTQKLVTVASRDKGSEVRQMRLGPVGVLCLHCQYHRIAPNAFVG
ncbi:MAG: hypothetical protein LYZ66_06150 [Nitrososphaerales archaeon]|nr:hypothetical protein [Nitrososphaerales archaeon]